ncbi:MAG: hypothetical protein HC896_14390, partial [Bacteroidales bacterium]|nr:hypothetical protein [Bacteroidales bacterium]
AMAVGSASITVTTQDGGFTSTCVITVDPIHPTSVSITNCPSANMAIGATHDLNEEVLPANATNKTVSWSSSNTSVATVNASGMVTAVSAGPANITATTQDGGLTATCTINVSVVDDCNLPIGWTSQDIGAVAATGTVCEQTGTFTIEGSGADIWGTADEFRYVYQSLNGDGQIIARVNSVENTNSWAKSGVMIRESLTAGSKHALMAVTAGNNSAFQRRTSTNGGSDHTAATGTAPRWVRLVRSGNVFTGSVSADGSNWTTAGSVTITMASNVNIGLATTSHNDGTLCTSEFTNVSLTGPVVVPVTGVALSNCPGYSLHVGDVIDLNETVSPSNATNKAVSWSSSNTAVLTVSSTGLATALALGTATITVTTADGGFTATCSITVAPVEVTSVALANCPSANLTIGSTVDLNETVSPANATDKSVSWSSSNDAVATVNASGLVTAQGEGTATITVSTNDGGFTADCAVTVEEVIVPDCIDQQGTVTAYRTGTAITVNGNLSESSWCISNTVTKKVIGNSDNTVKYGVLWDNTYLYVGAQVLDNNLYKQVAADWNNDAVEIYVDGGNNGTTTYDANDRQWIKAWNTAGISGTNTTGLVHAVANIAGGYAVEVAIPWTNFRSGTPTAGTTIGFDLGNNDDDNGGGRDYQMQWNGTINNWNNTSAFGDLVLSATVKSAPVQDSYTDNNSLVMYPNPLNNNQLTMRLAKKNHR